MAGFYRSLAPFLHWWDVGQRPVWEEWFGRKAPLDVEIGFGNGEALVRRAEEFPERNFVGLDLHWASTMRALRTLDRRQVRNVRVLQVDARVAFEWLFPQRSVQRVTVLFPCPWRKERSAKHRLLRRDFQELLCSRLEDGGEVLLVTDYEPYFEWVLAEAPDSFEATRKAGPPRWDTKYERKWASQGQREFFELTLTKRRDVDVPERRIHTLQTHRIESFDPDRLELPSARGAITVEPKEMLFDARRRVAMLRFIVVEDHLAQHLWIRVAAGEDGWRIVPAAGSGYLPTAGVQTALDLVLEAARNSARRGL